MHVFINTNNVSAKHKANITFDTKLSLKHCKIIDTLIQVKTMLTKIL